MPLLQEGERTLQSIYAPVGAIHEEEMKKNNNNMHEEPYKLPPRRSKSLIEYLQQHRQDTSYTVDSFY